MMTKTSLVLAAFAAAIAAQPAGATAVVENPTNTAAASSLPLIQPSAAALEQLKARAEESRTIVAKGKKGPFVRIIWIQALPKRV